MVTYVPLGEVPDVATLRERLNAAVSAASGAARRTLVLDGVDECQIPTKALTRQIVDAVTGLPDVRVVIGCRTGDWPTSLGEKLRESLGAFDVVELLPLSVEDIHALADSRDVDGGAFVEAVRKAGVGPLAALPLTLDLLLNLYSQDGRLPADARDLYERGLLSLVGLRRYSHSRDAAPLL
jgi:hypothetical protein